MKIYRIFLILLSNSSSLNMKEKNRENNKKLVFFRDQAECVLYFDVDTHIAKAAKDLKIWFLKIVLLVPINFGHKYSMFYNLTKI